MSTHVWMFFDIPDQRTAYVKRQVGPEWKYVRRPSVTPDLVNTQPSVPAITHVCL